MMTPAERAVVAVAGAAGCVGSALVRELAAGRRVVGLTRAMAGTIAGADGPDLQWRTCDLFSLQDVERALEGVDLAVYLVHARIPSARLTQGSPADFEVMMADNFARAARRRGIRHIVSLGGLVPAGDTLSPELAGRLEVERTLASHGTRVTALRAGLLVGPGSSWLRIVINLVRRLPVMLLPRWSRSPIRPVAVDDVARAIVLCLEQEAFRGRPHDLGGPEAMTFRDVLRRTAAVLGRRRLMVDLPVACPRLSRCWVRLAGGAGPGLAASFVEGLRHPVPAEPGPLEESLRDGATDFETALRASIDGRGRPVQTRCDRARVHAGRLVRTAGRARLAHRLPLPSGRSAAWAEESFFRWLPGFFRPFLRVGTDATGSRVLFLRPFNTLLLHLAPTRERSEEDRRLLRIRGGALARRERAAKPRFEFRAVLDGRWVLAAIHDFAPRLPWPVFRCTHAWLQRLALRAFGRHLRKSATDG